jgi:hypothetical protein
VISAALAQTPAYSAAAAVVLVAAVIEASYLFRIVVQLYRRVAPAQVGAGPKREAIAVTAILCGMLVATVLWLAPVGNNLQAIATQAADRDSYILNVQPVGVQP